MGQAQITEFYFSLVHMRTIRHACSKNCQQRSKCDGQVGLPSQSGQPPMGIDMSLQSRSKHSRAHISRVCETLSYSTIRTSGNGIAHQKSQPQLAVLGAPALALKVTIEQHPWEYPCRNRISSDREVNALRTADLLRSWRNFG